MAPEASIQGLPPSNSNSDSKLLELPPELFMPIILHVLQNISLVRAWQLRSVCKTFQQYIEDEILTNVPLGRFNDQDGTSHIIYDNLKGCILKRCLSNQKTLEANPLPCFLVRLVDRLLEDFPPAQDDTPLSDIRMAHLSDLIQMEVAQQKGQQAVTGYSLRWTCLSRMTVYAFLDHSGSFDYTSSSLKDLDIVTAAAAVGNIRAVRHYVKKDKYVLLKFPYLSIQPLQAAVVNDTQEVIFLILETFRSILTELSEKWNVGDGSDSRQDDIFDQTRSAIKEAISKTRMNTLRSLLQFEFADPPIGNYSYSRKSELMSAIIASGSLEMLALICTFMDKVDESSEHQPWWMTACLGTNIELVDFLLMNGVVHVGPNGDCIGRGTPLHWVSESGHSDVAKLLIKYGADINYHKEGHNGWLPTPLKNAAYFGNTEVARVLVEAGADVYLGSPLTAVFNCVRRDRHTHEVYDITRLLLDHGTPINRRLAWDVEKDAMGLITSGWSWPKHEDKELFMAIVAFCESMQRRIPRWRIPYADFWIAADEARQIRESRCPIKYSCQRNAEREGWPDMYFTSRILRRIAFGSSRFAIPEEHRDRMVAVAGDVWAWLEDWREPEL